MNAIAEDLAGAERIFPGSDEVAGVVAQADVLAVILDGRPDHIDLAPAMAGAVIVDVGGDLVFLGEFIEIVEGIGVGVAGKVRHAERLGVLENFAVFVDISCQNG